MHSLVLELELGMDLTFSTEYDNFGKMEVIELKEGGLSVSVTNDNKSEYVALLTDLKTTKSIELQIAHFLQVI